MRDLLLRHQALLQESSPAESFHVQGPQDLLEAGAVQLAARREGEVAGVGALRVIAPGHGEIKSMHTAPLFAPARAL